jgi:hypothetical protein
MATTDAHAQDLLYHINVYIGAELRDRMLDHKRRSRTSFAEQTRRALEDWLKAQEA